MTGALRLQARDAEDLAVVSAYLQDALLPLGEMTFLAPEHRFVMVVNRFRWEEAEGPPAEGRIYERVACAVTFEGVRGVRVQGIEQGRKSQIIEILALEATDGRIDLVFAGGGRVRLETDRIHCRLEDLAEPWPTQWRPHHSESEER